MAQLDQDEAMLAAEESQLRAKLAELEDRRQQLDREQVGFNQGWSTLYEMEERYHAEPVADRSEEIAAAEYRCAVLQGRFNDAQLHLEMTARQLESYAYVADRKKEQAAALERIGRGFEQVERRRVAATLRVEGLLEVESQRERKCQGYIQSLDREIRNITVTAGLPAPLTSSSSNAPTSARTSLQPQHRSKIVSFDQTPETIALPSAQGMSGLDSDSVCYGLGDDDFGLGDASVMYSVCGNLKKARVEAPHAMVR